MASPFLSSEEYDEQAHRFYDAGDYDAALEVLREGLAHHPESVLLHVGVGYVRMAREEYAWARGSFRRALDLDDDYEDAWVGLGETLLKFGQVDEAVRCFARVDEMGLADDLELGLTIGRALYREGLFADARSRFSVLGAAHPDSAEVAAARGYTLHALGDDVGARRELRRALRLDAELHEARIYLSHLLHDRGDSAGALAELERVPPAEHWDTLSLWRYIELKCSLAGLQDGDALFVPWRERLAELEAEPDEIDHLLAEVEASFEGGGDDVPPAVADASSQIDFIMRMLSPGEARGDTEVQMHRVRTVEGRVYEGTWEQIVARMRDTTADPDEPLASFMHRAALLVRERTGAELPCDTAEAFVRGGARIGLLRIES
ncbi:MAG TPA: tetratricopeptide repeat protein [Longimicrobiaceae bacterium]|jgi:Flp pilus assembly protein TadD|nr:tetratricopeptide repeat protein [Longimicrobiaceae bacterium]